MLILEHKEPFHLFSLSDIVHTEGGVLDHVVISLTPPYTTSRHFFLKKYQEKIVRREESTQMMFLAIEMAEMKATSS